MSDDKVYICDRCRRRFSGEGLHLHECVIVEGDTMVSETITRGIRIDDKKQRVFEFCEHHGDGTGSVLFRMVDAKSYQAMQAELAELKFELGAKQRPLSEQVLELTLKNQKLEADLLVAKEAFKKIMDVTGTSSLQHKIARETLAKLEGK